MEPTFCMSKFFLYLYRKEIIGKLTGGFNVLQYAYIYTRE